jgi:hypothetical protein
MVEASHVDHGKAISNRSQAMQTPLTGGPIPTTKGDEEIRENHHSNDSPIMRKHNSERIASASFAKSQDTYSTTVEPGKEISEMGNTYNPPIPQSILRKTYQTQWRNS